MKIPPEFFRAGGTSYIAGVPPGSPPETAADAVHVTAGAGNVFVPLFTSGQLAARYALATFGADSSRHNCYAVADLRMLGTLLDGLIKKGITHVAFDPDGISGTPSFSIHDVRDALYRHVVVPEPSDN